MADNVVRPLVISDQIRIHPLYVFFALLGGVQAFGISGLFIGPVAFGLAQSLFGLIREETRAQTDSNTFQVGDDPLEPERLPDASRV
jgi:predicted PurR-regulated permease PerM